jgi:hypothetical protein
MHRRIVKLALLLCVVPITVHAQEFKVFDRTVQIHGFASQGFVYTDQNNWLTMHSSHGSGAFTDFGVNLSTQVTDKLHIGAQVYDRNLGNLGEWHPTVDWAVVDYRFKLWLGVRGGEVKTVIGLYNDTQDLDFLRTFALLPQSVYPTDLRDSTIAHRGADVYGDISLKHGFGELSYTVYGGHRSDSIYSGYAYVSSAYGVNKPHYGGLQYGADLRWSTPLRGLLIGTSRVNEDTGGKGTFTNLAVSPETLPYLQDSKAVWTNQFYGQYVRGKLQIDSEYRRYLYDIIINSGLLETSVDIRGWYVSGSYRIGKRLAVGSYYSNYRVLRASSGPISGLFPDQTDTSLPPNHVYDKVISGRLDLNRFWNVKIEGHFMDGYGASTFPNGFYPQVNPNGFKPNTNALVLKTSVNF